MNFQRAAPLPATSRTCPHAVGAAGFSLIELTIAMAVALILLASASTLLSSSLSTRTRENLRSEALSDTQRALNLMSREISNSGYGLTDNGIVAADSGPTGIRIRANINSAGEQPYTPPNPMPPFPLATDDEDEDVAYLYQPANRALIRYDRNTNAKIVLARPVDVFSVRYLDGSEVDTTVAGAVKIRLTVLVTLPAMRNQPASQVQLTSDIALRNAPAVLGRY